MITLVAELYVAAIATTGLVVGLYLHARLTNSKQIGVKMPSPFRRATWIAKAGPAAA